jgi:ATP-dependent Clp protease, protease subunit
MCAGKRGDKMRKFPDKVIEALSQKRQILLMERIDGDAQQTVSALIIYLNSLSNEPITLFIDSSGGDTEAEMQLIDAISVSEAPICGVVTGDAFSAAFDILQACRIRKSYAHGKMLFHAPRLSGMPVDDEQKVAKEISDGRRLHEELLLFLSKRTGQSKEKWVKWSKKERKFTAPEALKLGIIDEIIQPVPLPVLEEK